MRQKNVNVSYVSNYPSPGKCHNKFRSFLASKKKQLKISTKPPHPHTSSLKSLLVSFLMGSRYCTWPAEKPTMRATLSEVAEY